MKRVEWWAVSILLTLSVAVCAQSAAETSTVPSTAPAAESQTAMLAWTTDYTEGLAEARRSAKPVLVRAGAVWCTWCKQMDVEIARPEVQEELRRWTRIYIDIDRMPREARSLAFGPVPALRILDSSGRLLASADGYMEAERLIAWLAENYAAAAPIGSGPASAAEPAADTVAELLEDLDRRDPAIRESTIRRLLLVPDQAAAPVVEVFRSGGLSRRLAALEILREWGGPVENLDPWQPETITAERLAELKDWAARPKESIAAQIEELTPERLAWARADIAKLARDDTTTAEAEAIRERLARYGENLLPQVVEAARQATSDRARERLTALRYRLVASDALVFSWTGGLERLSAMDVSTRHAAADELAGRCGPTDEALLLELFSDPDGLVREIALRGLHKIGGSQAGGALVRLLEDPEPNVRAAVLKRLAEEPSIKLVPKVAEYVLEEQDADLVVHAIRVLRYAKGRSAVECLVKLLDHANWQARAEAAEAIAEILAQGGGISSQLKRDTSKALLGLLEDSDSFVVSVAVKSLRESDMVEGVEALVKTADRHPELASEVLAIFAERPEMRSKAVPHLRRFCGHQSASMRAVAIGALCSASPNNVAEELTATLSDSSSRVRMAAATALIELIKAQRPQADVDAAIHASVAGGWAEPATPAPEPSNEESEDDPPATSSAPESESESEDASVQASGEDLWLERFRTGEKRPEWMGALVSPLQAMLTAEAPEERLAAAIALTAFGQDDITLPVLLAAVKLRPELAGTAAGALPWLPWEKRIELFETLTASASGAAAAMQIAENMAVWPDPRAAQPLWRQLGAPDLSPQEAGRILEPLRKIYFGDHTYNASKAPLARRRLATAEAVARARSGSQMQRSVALAILIGVSLKQADAEAATILDEPNASEDLKRDALQIRLLSSSRLAGQKLASRALAGEDPALKEMALCFLAEGVERLSALRNGAIRLYFENSAVHQSWMIQSGQPIKVVAPAGMQAEPLLDLLDNPDRRVAALAGYLLATLKNPAGLDGLINYWREQARDDQGAKRLVYRAISALGDDELTGVLEEVYRTYQRDDYWLRDFYWTIRSISGPDVLKLRKMIRDEVGMDHLR